MGRNVASAGKRELSPERPISPELDVLILQNAAV
jgi:hypothetical protein